MLMNVRLALPSMNSGKLHDVPVSYERFVHHLLCRVENQAGTSLKSTVATLGAVDRIHQRANARSLVPRFLCIILPERSLWWKEGQCVRLRHLGAEDHMPLRIGTLASITLEVSETAAIIGSSVQSLFPSLEIVTTQRLTVSSGSHVLGS